MFEQTSWILFLKYLDDYERDKKTAAELSDKPFTEIIAAQYHLEEPCHEQHRFI